MTGKRSANRGGGEESLRICLYSSMQIAPLARFSGVAGAGGREQPCQPPGPGEAHSSGQSVSGDVRPTYKPQLCCPPRHLPSLLGLLSCPFAVSAVGSWTRLSVPNFKASRELWPDLHREGSTVGQGGDQQPQSFPALSDGVELLCLAIEEHPPGGTNVRRELGPLICLLALHTRGSNKGCGRPAAHSRQRLRDARHFARCWGKMDAKPVLRKLPVYGRRPS